MSRDALSARMVLRSAALGDDLDKPVLIKLGLFDDRTITIKAHGHDAHGCLVLTLDDEHDFFPVGRYTLDGREPWPLRTHSEHRQRGGFKTDEERASVTTR